MTDEATRRRNLGIALAYVDHELRAGRDFLEERLLHLVPGLLGRLLNPVAKAVYHHIGEHEIRRRVGEMIEVLAEAAEEADAHGLEAALAKWTPVALEKEELVHRGRRDHPRHGAVVALLSQAFRERVVALGPVFAYEGPASTYDELLRGVYPDRAVPEAYVRSQIALGRRLTAMVRADPGLARFPAAFLPHLFKLVDEVTDWYEVRAVVEMERVYGRA